MIARRASVSVMPHECQMVTELPAGGGDKGGLGGSSVGVGPGVPVIAVSVGAGDGVPLLATVGVSDLEGVRVEFDVEVVGPGYGSGVFVVSGPGYGARVTVICGPGYTSVVAGVGFRFPPGPGYGGTSVSVMVGVGDCRLLV